MNDNKLRFAVRRFAPFESMIRKSWDLFCKESGCTMELDMVAMDLIEFYSATLGDQKGLINGDWDISHLNTDWIAQAVADDTLEDLTPYIAKNPPVDFPDGWSNAMREMQECDDKIIGLPFHNGPECMIYRKDLFESETEKANFKAQYGRELRVPATWNELIEVGHFFHRPDQNLYGILLAAFPDGHNTVFDFCLQLWTRGGEIEDENGHIKINTPQAAEGLRFYQRMVTDEMAVHPKIKEYDSVRMGTVFSHGEAAISLNWFGFSSMCEVVEDSLVKGKIGVANIPAAENGDPVSLNAYWLYTIAKGSRNKDVAYEFIQFLTRPEQDKMLTLEGGIGCRLSTWNDEEVNKIVPYYKQLSQIHQYSRTMPRKVYWSQIETIIDSVVVESFDSARSIEEILDDAQSKIDEITNIYEN